MIIHPLALTVSRVRMAERCDADDVVGLCRELHAENDMFAMSEHRVRAALDLHFDRNGGVIGVIGDPGHIEGTIVLRTAMPWSSDTAVLEELFSYVLPAHRRSTNARDLIEFAQSCARQLGVPLTAGVVANDQTAAKVELYRRRFGAPAGAMFVAYCPATPATSQQT